MPARSVQTEKLTEEQTDAESLRTRPISTATPLEGQSLVQRGGQWVPEDPPASTESGTPGSHASTHAKGAADDLVNQDVNVRTLTIEDIDASPLNDVQLRVIDSELQARNGSGTLPASVSFFATIFRALTGGTIVAQLQPSTAGTNTVRLRDAAGSGNGHLELGRLRLEELRAVSTPLTIASGVVTRTHFYHTIDTEAAAASDDLVTISGGSTGDLLLIRPANDARTVIVKHLGGNIRLNGNADLSLDEEDDFLLLLYTGSQWWEVSRSVASGGGSALTVSESGTPVDTTVTTIDFGSGFDVTEAPEDQVNVTLDLSEIAPPVTWDSVVEYVIQPDEAPGVGIDAGVQSTYLHTGPFDEVALRMYGDCVTAAGTSFTAAFEIASGDDLDASPTWAAIATLVMGTGKSVLTDTMSITTLSANRLIRLNITAVSGTAPTGATFTLRAERPLTT